MLGALMLYTCTHVYTAPHPLSVSHSLTLSFLWSTSCPPAHGQRSHWQQVSEAWDCDKFHLMANLVLTSPGCKEPVLVLKWGCGLITLVCFSAINSRARASEPVRGEERVRETSKGCPIPEEAKAFPEAVAVKLQGHFWFAIFSELPLDFRGKECSVHAELMWPLWFSTGVDN